MSASGAPGWVRVRLQIPLVIAQWVPPLACGALEGFIDLVGALGFAIDDDVAADLIDKAEFLQLIVCP